MDNPNIFTNLKISIDIENMYRSLYEGTIPWYFPTAFIALVIFILTGLVAIIIQLINIYKLRTKESKKIKLFNIPQKKMVHFNGPKNKAKKLMEKTYLPKSKEQILKMMKKVGANKVFIKGGKGAISGEFCTKDDIIDETIVSQYDSRAEETEKNKDKTKQNIKKKAEKQRRRNIKVNRAQRRKQKQQ